MDGKTLAEIGAGAAEDRAEAAAPGWSEAADQALRPFIASGDPFMAEDVRAFAHGVLGLPDPPDGRAWGAVFLRASRKGRIRRVGYAPMKDPKCHANPKTVWRGEPDK